MSNDYHHELKSDGRTVVQVNFTGITNGQTDKDSLGMTIYAYSADTGQAIFTHSLDFDDIKGLYHHLHRVSTVRESDSPKSGKFLESTDQIADLVDKIKALDSKVLEFVLKTLESEEKVSTLLKTLSVAELAHISAAHKYELYKKELDNLKHLLRLEEKGDIVADIKAHSHLADYIAGQPEKIFQNWIEKNLWVFGVEYTKKYDARKIAFFSESDILVESLDGFLDLIELKRPKDFSLFKYDTHHKCYYPSTSLSQVIGQTLFYLQKMDDFKLNIEKEYKVKVLRPRVKIIGGRSKDFTEEQYNSLRMLNHNMSNIQVYTYDYIVSSAEKVITDMGS